MSSGYTKTNGKLLKKGFFSNVYKEEFLMVEILGQRFVELADGKGFNDYIEYLVEDKDGNKFTTYNIYKKKYE